MTVRLILDTDMGSDVDDALALAFALRHPDIDLVAVTTVADDVVRRAQMVQELLRIAGREDIEVAPGVGWTESPSGRTSWFGHEGEGLIDMTSPPPEFERDGVSLLLEATSNNDVEISTIGMQSNIAAALDRDPEFAHRIPRLDVMGGVFAPIRVFGQDVPPSWDHNLAVDSEASMRSLNAGIPSMYVPVDITVQVPLRTKHLNALRQGDELCRTLATQIAIWIRTSGPPDDVAALLHDPLAVACIVDRSFVTSETLPVTVAMHQGDIRTFIDRAAGAPADVITSVDAPAFADFWLETVRG